MSASVVSSPRKSGPSSTAGAGGFGAAAEGCAPAHEALVRARTRSAVRGKKRMRPRIPQAFRRRIAFAVQACSLRGFVGTLEETSAARHAAYLGTAHFASLDGLRFLSIAPVVWHHCTSGPLPGVLGKGPIGVELFFAISGFLITTRLIREQRARGAVAIGQFYTRRALRIFPLYYAV